MPNTRKAADWTPEAIRRFWEWQAPRPQTQKQYFSRQVGRALANILRMAGGMQGRVLDFGCGPGYLLERITEHAVTAEGVDYSPRSVEETRKRLSGRANFKGAQAIDGLPTPLEGGSFDAITCIETIEHLQDGQLEALIAEILRLLKPGGVALLTTPNNEKLENAQAYCPFCDSEFHHMQHLRTFTPEGLRFALAGAGFDVRFCDGLDLWRFQKPRGRKFVDCSARDVAALLKRGLVRGAAIADELLPRSFPDTREFRAQLAPGPHLVAIARKAMK